MFVVAALLSNAAQAGPAISAEYLLSTKAPFFDNEAPTLGNGVGVRVGYSLDLLAITFTPEIGGTVWLADKRFMPEAGVRLQFAKLIEPGVYAHVIQPLSEGSKTSWDGGLSLDLTAIPKLDFGIQAGVLNLDNNLFLQAGAQVALNL